jgi:hypothetical protein
MNHPASSNQQGPWQRCLWVILILTLSGPILHAQHWSDGMMPQADWQTAKNQFDATWADSIPEKGKGFKPFQRWWHFAETRWAFEGSQGRFAPNAVWRQTEQERAGRQARANPMPSIWSEATPPGLPLVGGAGRTSRVVLSPTDTAHWFVCAPSGGLWQSFDSGESYSLMGTSDWSGMGVSDVAIDPQSSGHLLVATGDGDFGSAYGVGLLQTFDAGLSWNPTGLTFELSETHTVNRVHFQQDSSHRILAATSNGVWVSEDNGQTFAQTLEGRCSDLISHPDNPNVWHAALRPGAIHRSTDGGQTWDVAQGLPNPETMSRIALSASRSNPEEVWAIGAKTTTQGLEGIYHSLDSGLTYVKLENVPNVLGWTVNGTDLGGQGFYDLALAVDHTNPNHIVAGGVNLWSSHDGGLNWSCAGHWFGGDSIPEVHADHHALTFIPGCSDVISANDGGVARIRQGEVIDLSEGLNIGQVYHIGISEKKRDRIISGWQDNGVNFLNAEAHARVLGADGFHCMIHPVHPDTMYAAEYYGKTYRSIDGGWSWSTWILGNGTGVNERGDWDTPMAFSPNHSARLFVAKRRVYWTLDDGETWGQTDALPGDQIEAMALSASKDSSVIVAKGTLAFRTENLEDWSPLLGLPGLPVTDVLIHHELDSTFWVSFGGYDEEHRIWVTQDGGNVWEEEGSGLPALPVNTLVRDTATSDLYAGTDAGVYVLPFNGSNWTPYKAGLPEVLCSDLAIRYHSGELILGTYGRGIWKAPLHSSPPRDGALMEIQGATSSACKSTPEIKLLFRNAGTDSLVSATVLWNGTDTMEYGFVLAPNRDMMLPWPQVLPASLAFNAPLTARLLSIVSLSGGLTNGDLTAGPDALPENDIVATPWRHQNQSGAVIFETTADCFPLQSSWLVLDSTQIEIHRRQHFMPETTTVDTLCLTHGCHTLVLHDGGGDGLSGPPCGMQGNMAIVSNTGQAVWALSDPAPPEVDFGSSWNQTLCLPMPDAEGCNDPNACNFNPVAAILDGTCIYDCANPNCPADFNNDGLVGATDVLAVLSEYGCTSNCSKDMTGDGAVSANDILSVLALYGSTCTE